MFDLLVFTPVLRLEPETVHSIFSLEWDGPISFLLQRDNPVRCDDPREQGVKNHLHQYRRGRKAFLDGNYEGMLVIESDIIPPKDTLTRLAALDVDLAYGCYTFQVSPVVNVALRYGSPPGNIGMVKPAPYKARNVGESLSTRPGLWDAAIEQGVVDCSGAGLGCVLIKRRVLQEIDFRIGWPESKAHCDSYFTIDAYKADFTMKADTAVFCGHKTVDGNIKYPTYE